MFSPIRAWLVGAALLASLHPAHAGPLPLDLPTALARARERAPEAVAALARIGDARARRIGADVRASNPELSLGGGVRFGEPRSVAVRAQIAQPLELGRRGARMRVAEAGIEHAIATSEAELRDLAFEVAIQFAEARYAELEVELAQRDAAVAVRGVEAAQRRRKAGVITDLEVNLAAIAVGRARSAVSAARADRADAIGRLGALVGAQPDDAITLVGDLRPAPLTIDALRAAIATRADVRAIDAGARVARAEGSLATAMGRPDLGLWFAYERDEADTIALGGLTIALPLWNRSQGDKAAASARVKGAELERAAVLGAATRQIVDAYEAYERAREAVDVFDREVAPLLADSEQLLEKSLDSGQIAIGDYLVARQQILDGRREQLARELSLAKAATTARFVAGVTP